MFGVISLFTILNKIPKYDYSEEKYFRGTERKDNSLFLLVIIYMKTKRNESQVGDENF